MEGPRPDQESIINELTVICNTLGKIDENDGTYMRDRDCKPCLKEIQRYLGADSSKHSTRIFLGSLNVIKTDLIPLMVQYCDFNEGDPELFTTILRLCTNLTTPVMLLFENQEVPTEPDKKQIYDKLLKCLFGYKEAFASDEKIWSTLNVHLRHNDDDDVTFERLIILLRNILHIPVDCLSSAETSLNPDSQDMCLFRMEKSGILSTLIEIAASTQKGVEYSFYLMEVIYLMLREQNPTTIAQSERTRCKRKLEERDADRKRYLELSAREKRMREIDNRDLRPPRFVSSRVNGALFVAKNYRSIGGHSLIVRQPIESLASLQLNLNKTELRKSRNKKPMSSETFMMISDNNTKNSRIIYDLKIFCKKFVEKVYNNYMHHIKHNLIQKKAQENDESYYLWALHFFSEFNRQLALPLDNISEILSTSTLHFIQILINNYQDKIEIEKKKYRDTSKRLHLALRAYREILLVIKSIDAQSPYFQTVEKIQKNIFNELEYSTMIVNMLQKYDEPKHSLHYLDDLISTNDIFIDILAGYSNQDDTFSVFMTRYYRPDIVKAYISVLKNFKTNNDMLNLKILKFLERIAQQQVVLLEQASVLKCLLELIEHDSHREGYERFTQLARDIMRDFAEKRKSRRWMLQEILFWKENSDCLEIENAPCSS